ncbi:MAG TPA: aminotransferase class I/II-fold pyridoxal phosphate-dependent enzyme, partial [Herpetosiphonaceae bacterium]
FGAFVAGPALAIEYLVNACRSFVFTTALPPAAVGAALAALELIEREPQLVDRLRANAERLRAGLRLLGADTLGSQSQIIPLLVGESALALEAAQALCEAGVYAVAIRPPTVPPGAARIRASVMAGHSPADLDFALAAFDEVGRRFNLFR